MRNVLPLVLVTGLALISQGAPTGSRSAEPSVPVLKAGAVGSNALKQVTSVSPDFGNVVPTPIPSLEAGLACVKRTFDRPILAMAERDGWFFYATSVARDQDTDEPVYMISGYTIKRDGRRIFKWSVW